MQQKELTNIIYKIAKTYFPEGLDEADSKRKDMWEICGYIYILYIMAGNLLFLNSKKVNKKTLKDIVTGKLSIEDKDLQNKFKQIDNNIHHVIRDETLLEEKDREIKDLVFQCVEKILKMFCFYRKKISEKANDKKYGDNRNAKERIIKLYEKEKSKNKKLTIEKFVEDNVETIKKVCKAKYPGIFKKYQLDKDDYDQKEKFKSWIENCIRKRKQKRKQK